MTEIDPLDDGDPTDIACPDCRHPHLILQFETLWCDRCGWSGENRPDPQPSEHRQEEPMDYGLADTWAEHRGER